MIPVPDAFFLIASVCMILSAAAFIKVCYIWLRDAESERKAQHLRDAVIAKTFDEVIGISLMVTKLCDELGINLNVPDPDEPDQGEDECEGE